MIIGIACDDWKLSTFKKQLKKNNYTFEVVPSLTEGTMMVKVETDDAAGLGVVVSKANNICRSMRHKY